jgi:hypothetical protein
MIFIIVLSCTHEDKPDKPPYIIIDLEKSIDLDASPEITLNDISANLRIIPVETNDSVLFNYISIVGVTEKDIVVHDVGLNTHNNALYYVNRETGKVSTLVNRRGNGPGEYNSLTDVHVENSDSTVYIYDMHRINIYDFKGDFIKSVKIDSIGAAVVLNDGYYAVSFSPFLKPEYALGIYDRSWNLHRKSIPVDKDRKYAMIHFNKAKKYNDDYYYRPILGDTLYQVTSEYEKPYIVTSKGKYKIPESVTATMDGLREFRHQYVYEEWGTLISKYYFLLYEHNRNMYYDVWDIETSTLILRKKYSPSILPFEGGGIPVLTGDLKVNVWPSYVSGNMMYCTVEAETAVKLIPSLPWDTNPVILELEMKK